MKSFAKIEDTPVEILNFDKTCEIVKEALVYFESKGLVIYNDLNSIRTKYGSLTRKQNNNTKNIFEPGELIKDLSEILLWTRVKHPDAKSNRVYNEIDELVKKYDVFRWSEDYIPESSKQEALGLPTSKK